MNHTDIHKVKEIAKDFLYIEISTTDYSPIVVMHPFFESGIIPYKIDDEFKVLNIAENKKRSSVHTSTNGKENRSTGSGSSDLSTYKKIIQANFLSKY